MSGKTRKAGEALEKNTPEAAAAKKVVAKEDLGDLAGYKSYLDSYDRKARGKGSNKGTDRLSALDVRYVYDAAKDFGVDKYDAADSVLRYARGIEGKSRMGGGTEKALDRLRAIAGGRPGDAPAPEPPKEEKPADPIEEEPPKDDNPPIVINPPGDGDDGDGGGDGPGGEDPGSFLSQYIKDSFNARGGTLANTGDITAEGDVTLDNSVTNSNTYNGFRADGYRLNLGELNL